MIHETPTQPPTTNTEAARALVDLLVRVTGEQINASVKERLAAHERNQRPDK